MAAKTLEEVYDYFQNKPISLDDFDKFYVDADKGRGRLTYTRLRRRLENDPDGSLKILFAGHKGCGKTTELVRLQKYIEKDFIVLNFSVVKELDILNINYIELFIVTMEKLFSFVKDEERIEIDEKYIENISKWMTSKEITSINQNYMGLDIETGLKGGYTIPFISEFFAKFKAAAKSSSTMKTALVQQVEPKLSDLILNCNLLINEIKSKLSDINKKGLVIIMEDLDKVDLSKGEDIFYIHSTQLTQLNCHCIYTFPIALLYHIKFKTVKNNYDEDYVLPMIKVCKKEAGEFIEGIEVMKDIVKQRMDLSLFEDIDILRDMIKYSGGCLWDLFQMIKDASDNALDFERNKINRTDFDSAYKALKLDYEYTIAENVEKEITVDRYYEALKRCALDEKKKPESTDIMLDLRNNLTVLSYNDINWSDVHPVVKDILKEKELI